MFSALTGPFFGVVAPLLAWWLPRQRLVGPLPSSVELLCPRGGWFGGPFLDCCWLLLSSTRLGSSRRVPSPSRL